MPKKVSPKRKPTRKRSVSKKKRNNKAPFLGISFIIIVLLLLVAVTVVNNIRKRSDLSIAEIDDSEVVDIRDERPVEDAVKHSAEQLGVSSNLITRRVRDDEIHYSIQLDRSRVDLTFANMIITGHTEMAGGRIIRGEEAARGSAQILTIEDENNNRYVVRLSYARAGNYPVKLPELAIIVDDFGEYEGSLLDEYLATNVNVTFAVLPHLPFSRKVMEKSDAMGREVIIHIPMEPLNYPRINPGTNPILVEHSDREITRLVEGYIRNLPAAVGANNHMGSLATTDQRVMNTVLKVLQKNNLYFVDSRTTNLSVAYETAQRMLLPSAQRDIFLDMPDASDNTLKSKLEELRSLKDTHNQVVVITHCFDRQRLQMLNTFVSEAEKIGFEIVPVSRLFVSEVPEIL